MRARVTAPRTAHLAAPQMPPPMSGAYPAPPQHPQNVYPSHSPPHGVHGLHGQPLQGGNSLQGMSWGTIPPNTHGPGPSQEQSMWKRFLTWTGLRGR